MIYVYDKPQLVFSIYQIIPLIILNLEHRILNNIEIYFSWHGSKITPDVPKQKMASDKYYICCM